MSERPFGGTWEEPEPATVDELSRLGCFAADLAVIDAMPQTGAEATSVAVRAALRALLANGLITASVPDEVWFIPRPPVPSDDAATTSGDGGKATR